MQIKEVTKVSSFICISLFKFKYLMSESNVLIIKTGYAITLGSILLDCSFIKRSAFESAQ